MFSERKKTHWVWNNISLKTCSTSCVLLSVEFDYGTDAGGKQEAVCHR